MAKLLLNFAYIIITAVVILSNAQQYAISNNNNSNMLNQSSMVIQMHLQTFTTNSNNITNVEIENANKIIQLPVNEISTDTTVIEQITIIPSSTNKFINENIDNKQNESIITPIVAAAATTPITKFEEFTLSHQLIQNTNDDDSTTIINDSNDDDIEPINNIDDQNRNIYKITKLHKSNKLIPPPKRHIPETIIIPFKSNRNTKNNQKENRNNDFQHRYQHTNENDGETNLNIFHIITELYDQSQWNIDGIANSVSEICSNDMEIYLKALNNGEPWAIKGERF